MTKSEFASSPTAPRSLDLIVLIGIISPNKLQYCKDFPALSVPSCSRSFSRTLNTYFPQRIPRAFQKSPHTTIQGKNSAGCNSSNTSDHRTRCHLHLVIFYFHTEHRKVLIQPVINPSTKPSSKLNLYTEGGEPESLAQPKALCLWENFVQEVLQ